MFLLLRFKKKETRIMELIKSQISELFSTFLSSGGCFNISVEAMLNALSRHERSLFIESYDGEQCNGFRPRKWQSQGLCFELRIPAPVLELFALWYSISSKNKKKSILPSFMNSTFVVLPVRISMKSANASMADNIVNSRLASSPTLVGRMSMLGLVSTFPALPGALYRC